MTTDNETVYIVGIAFQGLAQVVFEASAIERTTHTDHAVTRQTESVQRQISHRIHRVRYYNQNGIRAVGQYLVANGFYDTCVHTDQLLTRHTRLTRQTGSDDNNIRISCLAVVIRNTLNNGVKAHQLSRLHDIHGFTLGKTLFDINKTYFISHLIYGQYISARSTYVTCAHNSYFAHNVNILYVNYSK